MTPKKIYLSKLVMAGAEILDKPVSDDDVEYIRADVIRDGSSEIPNDLEEAAKEKYPFATTPPHDAKASGWYNAAQVELQKAFIAGAKWQKEQMMKKDYPKWRRIKAGERLPCPAYVWPIAYDNYPDCFEGRLMPNIQGVKVGRDTWYLPVDVIHNLPKED